MKKLTISPNVAKRFLGKEAKENGFQVHEDLHIYKFERDSKETQIPFVVIIFKAKAKNSLYRYGFKTEENRQKFIDQTKARFTDRAESKKQYNEENKAKATENAKGVEVGSIFHSSWGYDQTQCDFYQVVKKVSAKTVVIRQIASKSVVNSQGHDCENRVCDKDNFIGEEMTKRIGTYGIKINSFATAKICEEWDSFYCSWYA